MLHRPAANLLLLWFQSRHQGKITFNACCQSGSLNMVSIAENLNFSVFQLMKNKNQNHTTWKGHRPEYFQFPFCVECLECIPASAEPVTLNIRERKTISVHNDRQNTGLQVNLEVLKSQQQTYSFLFNSGIIELIFVKLAGEIANGVVQTLHIFQQQHCSSPNFQFERSGQLRCSEHGVWQRRDLALSKAPWHSSDQTKSTFGQ